MKILIFMAGVLVGTLISSPVIEAAGAKIVGSGFVYGVEVTIDGEAICSDPYYWEVTKELECE